MTNARRRFAPAVASLVLAAMAGALLPAGPSTAGEALSAAPPAVEHPGAAAPPAAAAPASPAAGGQPSERFIVKFKEGAGRGSAGRAKAYGRVAKELGVTVKELRTTATGARVVRTDEPLDAPAAAELLGRMAEDPAVEYAEPDRLMQVAGSPDDRFYPAQWAFFEDRAGMRVPAAWDASRGEGVVVAVLDTGITAHSDLDAHILPGYDMVSTAAISRDGNGRDGDPRDEGDWRAAGQCGPGIPEADSSWHGTHVAGTIAAVTGNGQGVAGVAPDARVLPVRVLGACGGYMSDIADAMVWAAGGSVPGVPTNTTPARVLNLSLVASEACSATSQAAIDVATGAGSVVVVAAGNENRDAAGSSPANCENVVVVAASDRAGDRAWYSNYGLLVDLTAPGGDLSAAAADGIGSTFNGGSTVPGAEAYRYSEGTSMAAPHVAGVAALLLAASPSMTPAQAEARLKAQARPLPGACAEGCGAGLVDAAAALGVGEVERQQGPGTPVVAGRAAVGLVLSVDPGEWQPAPDALSYQWNRDGQPIPEATGTTYTPVPADLGGTITATVTGSSGAGPGPDPVSVTSAPTAPVAPGTLAPATPVVTGTRKVGYTLAAVPGTWTAGTTLRYQWFRGTSAISGATSRTYRLTGASAGKQVSVRVVGSKPGYTAAARVSAKTAAIAKGTLRSSTPTITGTTKVGRRLTAKAGTWTSGTTLKYQWYRSGRAISGAKYSTYRLATADRYDTIKVRVTGTKTGYTTVARYSTSTARVR